MKVYELETTPDTTHGSDWLAGEMLRRYKSTEERNTPAPGESTLWEPNPGEWHLAAVAEDGTWVKLCGPNVHKLHGRRVRVLVEEIEPGEEKARAIKSALVTRAPAAILEMVEKWKRSRTRDGDSEFMAGRRAGWIDGISMLGGKPWKDVRDALEKGEL